MPRSKSRNASGNDAGDLRAPYESVLNTAFHKLTSEILIFLLAYAVLLAGLALRSEGIPPQILTALQVVPVLGALAYVMLAKRRIGRSASGVAVRAGIAAGEAYVGGVRGSEQVSGPVKVDAGFASGKARVIGVDAGDSLLPAAQRVDADYLMALFERLGERDRRKLIATAQQLEDQVHGGDTKP